MRPPKFAIIGTGRCGTAYVAAALRANGIKCGHEQWWTPLPHNRSSGLDGDASWLALPDIESGIWSGPVLHITRHPIDVVASLLGIGFFTGRVRYSEFPHFALTHEPQLGDMPPLHAAVEWWVRWNRRCAAVADQTVRIEDTEALLDAMSNLAGRALDRHRVRRVPATLNHRGRADIDELEAWRLLAGRADEFCYSGERMCASVAR